MAQLTVRLNEEDADLLAWQAELENLPYGERGRRIKDVLRRGLGQTNQPAAQQFDSTALLNEVRCTVESALQNHLTHLTFAPMSQTNDESERADALLDALSANLELDDEDE